MQKSKTIKHSLSFVLTLIISAIISMTCFIPPKLKENTEYLVENAWRNLEIISEHPHPNGSDQLRNVESLILNRIQEMGIPVRILENNVVNRLGNPTSVRNIYAEIKGTQERSVLFLAHYDSVEISPGAGDNGMSVAAMLESVRALNSQGITPKTGIKILFTDGEEIGMLGAYAFVENHADLLEDVIFTVNSDGLGNGPLMIIEDTGLANFYFDSVSKPVGFSSISGIVSIAPKMGFGLDTRPFLEIGMDCITVSTVTGYQNYHSPKDTFESVSMGSLIHNTDSLYYLMKKTAETDSVQLEELLSTDKPTYFMPAYNTVVRYSGIWGMLIAILAIITVISLANKYFRKARPNAKQLLFLSGGIILFPALYYAASQLLLNLVSILTWNSFIQIPFYKFGVIILSVCILLVLIPLSLLYLKRLNKNKSPYLFGVLLAIMLVIPGAVYSFYAPSLAYLPLLGAILISIRLFFSDKDFIHHIANFITGVLFIPLLFLTVTASCLQLHTLILFSVFFMICYALNRDLTAN